VPFSFLSSPSLLPSSVLMAWARLFYPLCLDS
jgi:hypothetical protein